MKWRNIPNAYQDRIAELTAQLEMDPFTVLGIEASASDDEVRLAYRKRVRAYHPDRQDEFIRLHAQEVIKIVNSAYERICRARGM
jgi:DnaJ like chaperone protein